MSLNGHTLDNLDPEQNSEAPATPPTPEPEPVQLAFSFALAPQTDGSKTPWAKRIETDGLSYYLEIYEDLLNNPPGWETQYWDINRNRKREWPKKALYIAWACAPHRSRQPRTQKEFAEMLGVTPQTICKWRSSNPEMIELIRERIGEPLEKALADVNRVIIEQALDPSAPVQARKLYHEVLSEARAARLPMNPAQMVQLFQTVVNNINWEQLTPEQTERIAAGEHPFLVLVGGVGAETPAARTTGTAA